MMRYRFIVVMSAFVLASTAGMALAAEKIGVVGALTGTATATMADGTVRTLKVGDAVTRDDMLSTEAGSKMQVMLDDQSTITLNPNSKLKVSEFTFDESANDGAIKMDALKGAFRFIGGAVSKNREAKIKTPVSSIGIRGSVGDTAIGPNGETSAVFASGGQMSMTNANGETTTTTDFGSGFSMQTATDTPVRMTGNQINAMMNNFTSPTPPSSDNGGGSDDGSASGGDDSADSATGGSTGDGDANAGTGGNVSTSEVATENQRVETVNNLSGNNPNAFNDPESARSTIQQNINNGSTTNGGGNPTTNTSPAIFGGYYTNLGFDDTPGSEEVFTQVISELRNISRSSVNDRYVGDAFTEFSVVGVNIGNTLPFDSRVTGLTAGAGPFKDFTPGTPDFIEISGGAYKATGFQSISGQTTFFTFNQIGTNVVGNTFVNIAGSDIGDEIKILIGKEIPDADIDTVIANTVTQSNARNTGDITYYGFLPDLNNHSLSNSILNSAGNDGVGIFNFGQIDTNASVANNDADIVGLGVAGDFGVAVNWNNKQFFSGFIRWGEGGGNAEQLYDTVAFGQVDSTGGNPLFEGNAYTTFTGVGDIDLNIIEDGRSSAFQDNNGTIEALLIAGDEDGSAIPETQFMQPGFLLDTSGANGANLKANNNDQTTGVTTYKGFTAGFHERDANSAGGGVVMGTVSNGDADNFTITTNAGTNEVGADIFLGDGGAKTYKYKFGSDVPGNIAGSAFLSDDLYAAELGFAERDSGTDYTVTDTDDNSGYIANATAINDVAETCAACDYVHWGVWAASTDLGASGDGVSGEVDVSQLAPYVAGEITTGTQFEVYANATGGTVNYTGDVIGSIHDGTNYSQETGTFTLVVDLANRQFQSYTGGLGGYNINSTGAVNVDNTGSIAQTLSAMGITMTDGTNNLSGSLNGAFFGPAAQNVGGNFNANNGGSINANGVYLGSRP